MDPAIRRRGDFIRSVVLESARVLARECVGGALDCGIPAGADERAAVVLEREVGRDRQVRAERESEDVLIDVRSNSKPKRLSL